MSNKEEKFWEALRVFIGGICEAAQVAGAVTLGQKDTMSGLVEISDRKRQGREARDVVLEKMYKTYKTPSEVATAQVLIEKGYRILDTLKSLVQLLDTVQVGEAPKEIEPLTELMQGALEEMKKIIEYTTDRKANAMKIEARCHRIYTYEERGDSYTKEAMQYLYGQNQNPMALLYWKDVVDHLEQILDGTAGMVEPLQRLAE